MANLTFQVLLIDDDQDDYVVTRDLLQEAEQARFELTWVNNYAEGLEALHQGCYDVCLVDYFLGPETGLDLLKVTNVLGIYKPIILLTGVGNHDVDQQSMALGAADYLVKGVQLNSSLLERSILHAIERHRAKEKISLLTHALESLHDGVYVTTDEDQLLFTNQALKRLCRSTNQLDTSPLWNRLLALSREQPAGAETSLRQTELTLDADRGSAARTVLLVESLVQVQQHPLRFGILHDITERKQLELERDRFFNLALDCLFIADENGIFKRINSAWSNTLGYTPEDLFGQSFWQLILGTDQERLQETQDKLSQGQKIDSLELRYRTKTGEYIWVDWNLVPFPAEHLIYGSGRDISQRKMSEAQLVYENLHDSLTGLDNRVYSIKRLEVAIATQKRYPHRHFAVLFIDLDNFKNINDSLGHLAGDQLLLQVAHRLKTVVRGIDEVARLGGDEFLILLEDLTDLPDVLHTVHRLQQELAKPFYLDDREVFTSASIGIVFSNLNYQSVHDVIRDADIAMYRAKKQGKSCYEIFDHGMYLQTLHLTELESSLHRAIERQQFRLYYQPLVDLKAAYNPIKGFEVLLWWEHPEKGLIPASEFLEIVEQAGLSSSIGAWVLQNACQQLKTWRSSRKIPLDLYLSINLSIQQLLDPSLIDTLDKLLADTQLSPQHLKLEITEGNLINKVKPAVQVLHLIRDRGLEISLDDFGTNFSPLWCLQQIPISTVKIDQSFVADLESNERSLNITQSIVSLAQALGLKTIVEGIETPAQKAAIEKLGCDLGQGLLFSRPLLPREVEEFLHTYEEDSDGKPNL
jgi:diguanylate cyclase (GGDEF)-like protein/PAS domain S-box-containing protein